MDGGDVFGDGDDAGDCLSVRGGEIADEAAGGVGADLVEDFLAREVVDDLPGVEVGVLGQAGVILRGDADLGIEQVLVATDEGTDAGVDDEKQGRVCLAGDDDIFVSVALGEGDVEV